MGVIYVATNKINNKQYIGLTERTLSKRKWEHCKAAKTKKDNTYFHNALNKYGEENWEWDIIIEVPNCILNQCERTYIKLFNTLYPNGYNLTEGGEGSLGWKASEELIQKNREINQKRFGKKPECIETGIHYNSIREAERQTGIRHDKISNCCRLKPESKTAGGLHWRWYGSNITIEDIESMRLKTGPKVL